MPRWDTKPLAKAILARFGTFAEAMKAPEDFWKSRASGKLP
jgi:DNA repair protein RadC